VDSLSRTNISKDDSLLTSVPRAQTVEALKNQSEATGGRRRLAGPIRRDAAGPVPQGGGELVADADIGPAQALHQPPPRC
jgi:hypothetical protein